MQIDCEEDKKENRLKILHSISRDINNDKNQKNINININEIKKIRKNAINVSV